MSITNYRKKVYKLLEKQNFIISNKEKKIIQERTSNGRRFFFMVAQRLEDGKPVARFVKIPKDNSKKLLTPFKRSIEFARYVKERHIIDTRGVIAFNYDPKKGTPFVVMETFPTDKSKIGFIMEDRGTELLSEHEAHRIVDQMERIHTIPVKSLSPKLRKTLQMYRGDYRSLQKDILRFLNKKVQPLDAPKREAFYIVAERHLKIRNFREKIKALLTQLQPIIDSKQNRVTALVHGDMSPNNLYIFDSGDVELLDLEWVGIFNNKAIAMVLDFGNLRARSWSNEKFRDSLDSALIKIYRQQGQEQLGKAIVQLSILRSHLQLSSCFENYKLPKQKIPLQTRRRKATERDIIKAFTL